MATATIPCKRPKITKLPETSGLVKHACLVPGCDWTFVSVKSAEEPKWHRDEHRLAVPKTAIGGPTVSLNYFAICECSWRSDRRVVTRTGTEAELDRHLSADHGLVTCA